MMERQAAAVVATATETQYVIKTALANNRVDSLSYVVAPTTVYTTS